MPPFSAPSTTLLGQRKRGKGAKGRNVLLPTSGFEENIFRKVNLIPFSVCSVVVSASSVSDVRHDPSLPLREL